MNRIQKTIRLVSMAKTCILPSEEATVYFKMLKEAGNACDIAPFEIFLKNWEETITLGNWSETSQKVHAGIVYTFGSAKWHIEAERELLPF